MLKNISIEKYEILGNRFNLKCMLMYIKNDTQYIESDSKYLSFIPSLKFYKSCQWKVNTIIWFEIGVNFDFSFSGTYWIMLLVYLCSFLFVFLIKS